LLVVGKLFEISPAARVTHPLNTLQMQGVFIFPEFIFQVSKLQSPF
jgi:hypothetical protein